MLPVDFQTYVPVLRLKQGEYQASYEVRSDVRERILPHWILTPPKERDPEKGRPLTDEEFIFESGRRIGEYWPLSPCLVDARFLFDRFADDDATKWLPTLFEAARRKDARCIPVASLTDLDGDRLRAFQAVVQPEQIGLAVRLTLTDLVDTELTTRLHRAMLRLVAKPHQCLLILDLSGSDLTNTEIVADIITGAYQTVMEIGLWRRVIVESTSYPEKNIAEPGQQLILPRTELVAWRRAIERDEELRRNLMFGDFGADSAMFRFKAMRRQPIPHLRYSTPERWLISRGRADERSLDTMRKVASAITGSGHFKGRGFSRADEFIDDLAAGRSEKPGNATTWRRVNTVHHLTMNVGELGPFYGYELVLASSEPPPRPQSLFGEE